MTVSFKAKLDNASWSATLEAMEGKKIRQAVSRALNKTAVTVRKEANPLIREERNLAAKVVRDAMTLVKASSNSLSAAVVASGRPVSLREFKPTSGKRGVAVAVIKGKRKLIGEPGRRAFKIEKFGNHIYQREATGRTPIKQHFGPSLPTAFVKGKVQQAALKVAGETWPKRMTEELNYELNVATRK